MRAYVVPTGLCYGARAMQRISRALARYAPPHVQIVSRADKADLQVLYVIAPDALQAGRDLIAQGRKYAAIQCCWNSLGVGDDDWAPFWQGAALTYSYYDMSLQAAKYGFAFYHAPLGLDDAFIQPFDLSAPREPLCVTTGYSEFGEAISEVWKACSLVGLRCFHVGPNKVEGMHTLPANWTAREGLTDEELAALMRRATWVSGLRHVEGLEIPCFEGLSCGARPICFSQPAMRHWYADLAEYVEDRSGSPLVDDLVQILSKEHRPVTVVEQLATRIRFNWETICRQFWSRLV